ncbi:CRISPR-associated helicase/endonuclease Cas3 [Streptococcus iniae]|nr:CRISPR-associated helicase/endonuclease Cas3 [Streptococcus iniae]
MILAHFDVEKNTEHIKKQTLEEHSINVAQMARESASSIGQGDVLFLIGLYHDLGKADKLFQDNLLKNPNMHVDHSYAGAKYLALMIQRTLLENAVSSDSISLFNEIVGYVITAHHGMYDIYFEDGTDTPKKFHFNKFYKRREEPEQVEKYHFVEDVVSFAKVLEGYLQENGYKDLSNLIQKAYNNYQDAWGNLAPRDDSEVAFYSGCMVRLYLSLLKNADILDTINAYDFILNPRTEDENNLLRKFYYESVEALYASFGKPKTRLNQIRSHIAERVKERGEADSSGIYRLNLPTGAGKTNLSLRYASHQMVHQGKKRFFYITPFLSVLEQNAAAIKNIIGQEGVLEHHSNVVHEKENLYQEEDGQKDLQVDYLIETWDSPVVLSSMVQFFQTLFKTKSANLRRFANLMDSVIVLDEVQSLPIEVTNLFNLMMNFLNQVMNTTIVLCTATQPVYDSKAILHQLVYGGKRDEQVDIVEVTVEEKRVFARTELHKFEDSDERVSLTDLTHFILERDASTLIILNTKPAVANLYSLLESQTDRPLYQLSTNMCPQHRLDIIKEIKEKLANDVPLICVSTQLIEAGVDVDIEEVIRSYAGIDSIVQAAGRCNREGKREKGRVTLVNLLSEDENLTRLKEIFHKKDATERILNNSRSPIAAEALNNDFFNKYYDDNKQLMDYPLKDGQTVYNYLSLNQFAGSRFSGQLKQSFKTAGNEMKLIDDNSISVIVSYGEGKKQIAELEEILAENPYPNHEQLFDIKNRLKQLQLYTVNIRQGHELLQASRSYLEGQILMLQEEYYDEKIGLKKEAGSLIL